MPSPIERLEAWCVDAIALNHWTRGLHGPDLPCTGECPKYPTELDRVVTSYRNIINEYRTTEIEYERNLDEYSEGAKHALLGVIAELADAVNPEQETLK